MEYTYNSMYYIYIYIYIHNIYTYIVYVYIYIYTHLIVLCIYIYIYIKRVLECGVLAPVFYGHPLEQAGEHRFPRKPTVGLFRSYRISGNFQELTGQSNLDSIRNLCLHIYIYI